MFSVISGLVVYDEAADMSDKQMVGFLVGVLLTVAGVYSLSQRQGSQNEAGTVIPSSTLPQYEPPSPALSNSYTDVGRRDSTAELVGVGVEPSTSPASPDISHPRSLHYQRTVSPDHLSRTPVELEPPMM